MSEIRYLLPRVERYFKSALHIHTSLTDGDWTPEELKAAYKEKGYSIVAYSDHGIITKHPELDDEEFLALTSYEMDVLEPVEPVQYARMYHLNVIAKDRDNLWQAYRPRKLFPNIVQCAEAVTFGGCTQIYSVENINRMIAESNAHGFLVFYNHPTCSDQSYEDYIGLEGLWGVEVYNHDCWVNGIDEINHRVYRDMLKKGKRVFPIASDDGHEWAKMDGGWVMIGAEKLEYGAVISALEKGDFYASTGPEIRSLTLEGSRLKITCSEAVRISVHTHCRMTLKDRWMPGMPLLTEKEFDLSQWMELSAGEHCHDAFFYLSVDDAAGHTAWTRPFWYDELF